MIDKNNKLRKYFDEFLDDEIDRIQSTLEWSIAQELYTIVNIEWVQKTIFGNKEKTIANLYLKRNRDIEVEILYQINSQIETNLNSKHVSIEKTIRIANLISFDRNTSKRSLN